jgi:drug/metabolite transporter (DMT)-like permease
VNWSATILALLAAATFGATSALQHHAASQEERYQALDPRLVVRLARRPLWLAGVVCDGGAFVLQTLALVFGPLSLVEPLLTGGLFFAVPFEAALDRRRPHPQDLAAAALATLGLAGFLLVATPHGGTFTSSARAWAPPAAVVGVLTAAALVAARGASPMRRATCLGLANGLLFGMTAGLLKACTDLMTSHPARLLTSWPLYALVTLGALGFILSQASFQDTLTAPLIAMTLTEPVVGLALGVAVFHEHLAATGPRAAALAVAGVVMVAGVWLAVTSPARAAARDDTAEPAAADGVVLEDGAREPSRG